MWDKCFDTQRKSVPHNKVKRTHNKVQKHTIKFKKHTIKFKNHNKSSKNTQTENTIKTKGLGLV